MISLNLQPPMRDLAATEAEEKPASGPAEPSAPQPDLAALAERLCIGLGNRYEVLDPVAIGGMATVLRLRHRLHGGLFVAKVLHSWLAEEPAFRSRLRSEAAHVVALACHPHIVPVIDLGEIDGLVYIVMPYIEGEDLDTILQRGGALERAEALMLCAHITSVLVAAQRQAIVHCDISPGNIRLDSYGMYRLMDFGLSRKVGANASAAKPLAYTPLYASPEQWRGEPLDARSDLYSLGVVLLEALSGASPFLAASVAEIEQKHLSGDWVMPPSIALDAELAQLLHNLLACKKDERIENAEHLAAQLTALGSSIPELRSRPLPPQATQRSSEQRNRLSRQT